MNILINETNDEEILTVLSFKIIRYIIFRLDLVVFYDDPFRDKFGDRSFTRISSIMALVAEQYSEASFKTKLQITLTQVKHIVGQNWGALEWNKRYPNRSCLYLMTQNILKWKLTYILNCLSVFNGKCQ